MPIKFRCRHCRQYLGISRSKAGAITDCPTCGRTIRIPDLDGRIAPLPKPKLNLEDDELVQALGALASFEDGSPAEKSTRKDEEAPPAAPAPRTAEAPIALEPAPEPVVVEPEVLPAESAAPAFAHPPESPESSEPPASPGPVPISKDEMLDLEILPEPTSPTSTSRPSRTGLQFGPGVLLLGCMVSLVCGIIIGRALISPASPLPAEQASGAALPPDAAEPDEEPADGMATLTGRLTYVSPTGEPKPDRGARILVLPLERTGTAKLSTTGFRVGASDADQQVLAAAVRALGGEITLAGEDGTFSIAVPEGGRVGILMASRYQSRDDSSPLPEPVTRFIGSYFDRPDLLIGQVQYHFQTVHAEPGTRIELDYEFPPI
jgi:hypothetical protein